MKIQLLLTLVIISTIQTSLGFASPLGQPVNFTCVFLKNSGPDGNPGEIPYSPDKILVSFLTNGQFQAATRIFASPLRSGLNSVTFLPGQSDKLVEYRGLTYKYIYQNLGGGLSLALAFPIRGHQGEPLSPLQSMVAIEYGEAASQYGRLLFWFINSNFPAKWRQVFNCSPT